jgi:transitional endoplasmic reticulum ATPase
MSDIERGLVAHYVGRVLARGDLPLRTTRYILYWLNERAELLSLPLPKPLVKAVGSIYSGGADTDDLERIYRLHQCQVLDMLRAADHGTPRPEPLSSNIDCLVTELGLPRASAKILRLVACYTRYEQIEYLCDHVTEALGPISRAMAALTGEPARQIDRLLAPAGELAASGLLQWREAGDEISGLRGRFAIPPKVNAFLDQSFQGFEQMREAFLGRPFASHIELSDFEHAALDRDLIVGVLRGAAEEGARGVNILLYGPPGSGKTELCKVAAAAAGLSLHGAGEETHAGGEADRSTRLADLVFAQRLLVGAEKAAILFDEMEDVAWRLIKRGGSKLYLNRLLENNPAPVLWTSNNVEEIDSALLRRMTLAIELKLPPARQRERILRRLSKRVGVELAETDMIALAHRVDATPAIMENALKAARYARQGSAAVERAAMGVVRAVSGAQIRPERNIPEFDARLAASEQNLQWLTERLCQSESHAFSLCLSGPPGTGKSAYGRHLAGKLGLEVIHKRASDLLGAYVGESEKRIAAAFEEARDTGGFLIFDEAESLLFDRRDARRPWEISQVNEMLTWMEDHPLPVCCTTNLMERFDAASFRRFTFHIGFGFLSRNSLLRAYEVFFNLSEIPEAGRRFVNLTPGDFAQARRQAELLGVLDKPDELVELLANISRAKPGTFGSIGFAR